MEHIVRAIFCNKTHTHTHTHIYIYIFIIIILFFSMVGFVSKDILSQKKNNVVVMTREHPWEDDRNSLVNC
jgi:hypothetical protein